MLINHIKSCEGKDKQVQLLLVDCNYINHFKRLSEVLAGSLFNAIVLAAPSQLGLGCDTQILPLSLSHCIRLLRF